MLQQWVILAVSFAYISLLFAIAYYGDKRADIGRSIISNPYIYTLSIAVYCTAWTFYGSVGRATVTGVGFLPIYLGPTLMATFWYFLLRKIIRITKLYRITSIADFVASRYGKSSLIGGLVTIIAVVGIMPYISLQLKAVSTSFNVLHLYPNLSALPHSVSPWGDTALYVALILAAFSILFGTRHIDATERHEGMVAAIAFESIVKLIAFTTVGIYVTFVLFKGPGELFGMAMKSPDLTRLMDMGAISGGYTNWFTLTFLSMMAIMFLPRQFQVLVVENVNEAHLKKAMWLFPLYLLAINLFVLPIAFAGMTMFPGKSMDPDTFVLTLPLANHLESLALFVFIGGLSAATGMVIVASIALSTMICNDLVVPVLLRLRLLQRKDLSGVLLAIRRSGIVLVLLMGYLYFRLIGESYALVTIGLVSFAAASQFAPAILIGIFWKGASRKGAIAGLLAGFFIWAYTLLLPSFAISGWIDASYMEPGPFGISLLGPYHLFNLGGFDPITHSVFWSMLFNAGLLVGVSLFDRQSTLERVQASMFVDVFSRDAETGGTHQWHGSVTVADLRELVGRFIGTERARETFARYGEGQGGEMDTNLQANSALVEFAERQLSGAIGAASARIMVSSVVKGEALSIEGVMKILDETSQVIEYSHRLEQKSQQLEEATLQLKRTNLRLKELDRMKDEFVSTVSHELRTPLTSIRAFTEILHDNPEMDEAERQKLLGIVVKETERLTRLINQVLDLDKIEAGRVSWAMEPLDINEVARDALASISQLIVDKSVKADSDFSQSPVIVSGDRDQLMQVVINLLSNAVKYCAQSKGQVAINVKSKAGEARLEVWDNGAGIAPQDIEQIFERFHQLRDTQSGKPEGSGLGLAISRRIVEHHGGRITVQSSPGKGATFIITLPLATGAKD